MTMKQQLLRPGCSFVFNLWKPRLLASMTGFLQLVKKDHGTLNSKINSPRGTLYKDYCVELWTMLPRTGFTISQKGFSCAPPYSDPWSRPPDWGHSTSCPSHPESTLARGEGTGAKEGRKERKALGLASFLLGTREI